ncbi:MAG: hypothetical protein HXY44_11365 [Syntrophaceae bacterium]|nr:hypothetical protein [Syntrophaceae bacterium]
MNSTNGSKTIQNLFTLTRNMPHPVNRPISKALETGSSGSIASLNIYITYLADMTAYFSESDRRSVDGGIDLWDQFVYHHPRSNKP